MKNFRNVLLAPCFLLFFLSGCASNQPQVGHSMDSAHKRVPASQTQLSYSAGQVHAALEAVELKPDLWFSKIQAIRIVDQASVEIQTVDEDGKTNLLKFRIFETQCGSSVCPLEAQQIP